MPGFPSQIREYNTLLTPPVTLVPSTMPIQSIVRWWKAHKYSIKKMLEPKQITEKSRKRPEHDKLAKQRAAASEGS